MDQEQLILHRLNHQMLLKPQSAERVVGGLIGLQAQYGAAALHALKIRASDAPDLTQYVKTWSFRGTLHLHRKRDLPLVLYAGSESSFGQMSFLDEGIAPGRGAFFREIVAGALSTGDKTREELKAACIRCGMNAREMEIILHPWGGLFRAMAEKGEIAYTAGGNRVFTRLDPLAPMEEEAALREMMLRYVTHYAPVSLRDAQTFFGLPQRKLKCLLELTATQDLSFQGQTYFTMGQRLPADAAMPDVLFLAGFDQMLLGYRKNENPILPQERIKSVYNNTGIIFPTVLLHGLACAVWKRTGNRLEIRPFQTIGSKDRKKIERKAVDNFGKVAVQWTGMQATI
ncbi:MAG: crosslink repair DNA glycosylase YcaQ family protein [Christensenella sp.]|nr:crosslink repair DNA glycosylase YcaQ family protein [Christensenella sp.]